MRNLRDVGAGISLSAAGAYSDSARAHFLGATQRDRIAQLDQAAAATRGDHRVPADGLGLLLVALGNHRVPFFWRFHNVHHTDLELDVTTAARFHFGEILFSIPFRLLLVVLLGIPPLVYLVFEIVFESASVFHHSNWRLSLGLERILNHVIVTPRMHGIHHSIVERETDSNWGTIFCWWDKIHRSLRRDIPQAEITIGVAAFRDEEELTVGKLLTLPFKEQRPWRLPSGEVPEREPQRPADELQP